MCMCVYIYSTKKKRIRNFSMMRKRKQQCPPDFPAFHDFSKSFGEWSTSGPPRYWAFHISVVDGFGFGRDSTYISASFQPDVEGPWDFYQVPKCGWKGRIFTDGWPDPQWNSWESEYPQRTVPGWDGRMLGWEGQLDFSNIKKGVKSWKKCHSS